MKFLKATIALAASASAWWGDGHLLVARIAQDILEKDSPDTLAKAVDILSVLKKSDPSYTEGENKHPFVECSTFADDIKYRGGAYQSGWHYIDQPYVDQGKLSDYNFTADAHNVTEAIGSIVMWLKEDEGYDKTYVYDQIMTHGLKNHTVQDGLSTAIRLLIHYCGDIHQPLHATARVDKAYPEGDRGGNDFKLPSKDGAKNLHAVWDSVIYEFTNDMTRPLSDADWTTLGQQAATLVQKHDVSKVPDLDSLSSPQWALDGFKISETFLYKDITENDPLPDDYDVQALDFAEKQIVIGGNRLAHLMISLKLAAEQQAFLQ